MKRKVAALLVVSSLLLGAVIPGISQAIFVPLNTHGGA